MLHRLTIENFKGWKGTGSIGMRPITLFFGANSSGKSSIGQFLMMLKQTASNPDRNAVLHTGGADAAVQLGSYEEMVFERDARNPISFRYVWSLPKGYKERDPISGDTISGSYMAFLARIGAGGNPPLHPALRRFLYVVGEQQDDGPIEPVLAVEVVTRGTKIARIKADPDILKRQPGKRAYGSPIHFYGFSDEAIAAYQNAGFFRELALQHEQLFQSMYYLGPLRTKAERLYTWTGTGPQGVGYAGENTVPAILASKGRRVSFGKGRKRHTLEEAVARKLKDMGLIEGFKVRQISRGRQDYQVKIRTKGSGGEEVDLPDVGFGVSQVLPVLVQCLHAPPNSIIIMEQPEIHLHPSAQSALADVMIDVINSRENNADRNIQLIIETHSEHFLRRLQRRIAEKTLPKDKVSAYFANVNRKPAKLEPLDIDEHGNIKNWPKDFFGDEMGDILAQAKAGIRNRAKEADPS